MFFFSFFQKFLFPQALISNENGTATAKETIVKENGKVMTDHHEDYTHRFVHSPPEYYDIKTNRPLRLKKKLYEFYTAPITKFWASSVRNIPFPT